MANLRLQQGYFLSKLPISLGSLLLIIFYGVGFWGIGFSGNPSFVNLPPFNLLLSLVIMLSYHPTWKPASIFFITGCYLFGFAVEVVGVNTGLLFGYYEYGSVLGYKVWNTPLMIGVNWILLVYGTGMTINYYFPNLSTSLKAVIGGLVMMALDILIEPIAVYLKFWSWQGDLIPIQNYLMWWLVSFVLLYGFHNWLSGLQNKVARTLLALQFCFFGGLNLILILT